ncbi:ABC transporter substrate-binding protein [Methylobacterium aerolatum]|uniref:Branched-chain amino acid transport system substrate-binding protein n=1 Tax=Methylobacterium aerolatum TaxID=418708 RepID=A0ABU0HZI5_9HYPH|nr:ABC transporter substrate-binding protein [Methylobacterium aerolatum]MDQ0447193.1 branched-chain amino acid transport system substrate-binding protein [Methylobacterium aerolatum]GJD36861.1 Leucine-, isoleucine-, valine-, threonine-, and alanine-binding protein [Methylobacterium aerolatum]
MTVTKRALVGALLCATALSVAPFHAAFAADAIKIGLTGPYTGGSSAMGVSMRDGAKLAAAEINKNGGVLGKQIQLVERDDEAKNEVGAQVAQELINKEKVVATVGFINTGVALAAQRFYQEAEIPVFNNVATGTIITEQFKAPDYDNNYVFRNSAYDVLQAGMMVDEALRLGYKKIALLADSTNYGQLGREDIEKQLAAKKMKPVVVEKFNIKDVDMTAQLLKAKEADADVILAYGIGPELAQIANGMAKLGWKKPMITSWPASMQSFIDIAGTNGNGVIMPQTFIEDKSVPKRAAFLDDYYKSYGVTKIPTPVAGAQGYDSVYLIAAAIKQAGSTDGPKIREALENLNTKVEGVVTTYDHPFTAKDHNAISRNMVVFGKVQDGKIVYANPDDAKNASTVRVKEKSAN